MPEERERGAGGEGGIEREEEEGKGKEKEGEEREEKVKKVEKAERRELILEEYGEIRTPVSRRRGVEGGGEREGRRKMGSAPTSMIMRATATRNQAVTVTRFEREREDSLTTKPLK